MKNGLTLVLLEDHKLPTVTFSMSIRPGQLADPADLPGLASFTAGMLREGTERRTSAQISTEVDTLGASLNAGSGFGSSSTNVNASGLINDAAAVLDLMSDIVLASLVSRKRAGPVQAAPAIRAGTKLFESRLSSRSAHFAARFMWMSRSR